MARSRIMEEICGSRASEIFVRSTYEIVYMTRATGTIRSHRCWGMAPMVREGGLARKDYWFKRGSGVLAR